VPLQISTSTCTTTIPVTLQISTTGSTCTSTPISTSTKSTNKTGTKVHTVLLKIQDDGGNVDTEVATVTIRPFGYPAISALQPQPNQGGLIGL
jgi:hypothetical protein